MVLHILALALFIFGAYAYGSLVVLSLRHRTAIWSRDAAGTLSRRVHPVSLTMMTVCTVWFLLHGVLEWRTLIGLPPRQGLADLAVLILVFAFPGLIFHTVLLESSSGRHSRHRRLWYAPLMALYVAGAVAAAYFPAVIFDLVPRPAEFDALIGLSIGTLFTLSSLLSLVLMGRRPTCPPTRDQQRMHQWMQGLFAAMIVILFVVTFLREQQLLIQMLDVGVRAVPLAFLIVSIYFENRLEFYDLLIKRTALLLLSLGVLTGAFAATLWWSDAMPPGVTRSFLFAVVLLPIVMAIPWLHAGVGRWLDRWWFGRDFTPVEAVKHVLAGLQEATDERTLVAAAERTLSEMFRTRVTIDFEGGDVPPDVVVAVDTRTSASAATPAIRVLAARGAGARPLLSEDHALLRSLVSVFGFMLENVRLQQRRQEQDQLAQELRLQSSRSELKALRAQINPHFLFNALNAIASLIHTDPARADNVVEQLAEVFRYTLRRSDQEWAPLDQELAFARAYLDVEQARFGRRLAFTIDTCAGVGRAQVPSMLLQTLVENAVKHGISRLRGPGAIAIRATREHDRLRLEVRDSGPGLELDSTAAPAGEGFGLRSVRERLRGHFGANASLEITREHTETIARLQLPFVEMPMAVGATR